MLNKIFKLQENQTSVKTELLAGVTTFITMCYIVFVNPGILSAAGVPFEAATTATALGAALMCVCMGLVTNRPLALASGMGLNAVLAFSVIGVHQAKVPWQVGMAVIFAEGVIIFILVMTGLREAVMNAIPLNLKRAIGVGIGLFITLIGFNEGGIIRPAPITLMTLGDLSQKYVWVTLIGVIAILVFMSLRVKGDILWGILTAAAAALVLKITDVPATFMESPSFETFFAPFQQVDGTMALARIFTPVLLTAVFAIMLTDFFDTMGTVVAVGEQAGFVEKDGRVPGIKGILAVDSLAAATGGLFGASSITTYIESAAGVAEGGRTGLTAIVVGILFAVASFFAPVVKMIGGGHRITNAVQYSLFGDANFAVPPDVIPPPGAGDHAVYPITACALIVVGFLMIKIVREIDWDSFEESFPAFLAMVLIPLTYNISYGIGFGFISYTLIKIFHRKFREVHPLMYIVSIAFLISFILPYVMA